MSPEEREYLREHMAETGRMPVAEAFKLLDALEAAERERDDWRGSHALALSALRGEQARSDRAEALVRQLGEALDESRGAVHGHLAGCSGCSASIHGSKYGQALAAYHQYLESGESA